MRIILLTLLSAVCAFGQADYTSLLMLHNRAAAGGGALSIRNIGQGGGSFVASYNVTTTDTVAANEGILAVHVSGSGTLHTMATAATGFTFTTDVATNNAGNNWEILLQSAPSGAGLASGATVTMTPSVQTHWYTILYAVKLKSSAPFDVGAARNNAHGSSPWSGQTAAIAGTSGQFAFIAFVGNQANAFTADARDTGIDNYEFTAAARRIFTQWRTVSGTGLESSTNTLAAADSPSGLIGVYKSQ
jgi:hypothetical protein